MKAVIFDLDGTLLDTLADIASAMNSVLRAHDLPEHPTEDYASMVGWGLRVLVERAVPSGASVDLHEMTQRLHDAYHADPYRHTAAYPGVIDLLTTLRDRGIPQGVLSNKAHSLCSIIVEATIGLQWFTIVEGRRDDRPAKPAPDGAYEVARALARQPEDTVFVGDSAIDIETARNAGMMPVGVSWGFRAVGELADAGAKAIIHSPAELLRIIGDTDG